MNRGAWYPFHQGFTIGQSGSEGGVIVRDEEHQLGARLTLERNTPTAQFTITCGVYGWMVHTRFFSSEADANAEYDAMREALTAVLDVVPDAAEAANKEKMNHTCQAIAVFVERFP